MNNSLPYKPICIPDDREGFRFVNPSEIICIKSEGRYCDIYCLSNKVYKNVSLSINEIAGRVSAELFCRVHRSYIVSLLHMRTMNKPRTRIYCAGDLTVHISETYLQPFLEQFGMNKISSPGIDPENS